MNHDVTLRISNSDHAWPETFTVTDCPSCGIVFALPASYIRRRRDDAADFYCPSGHRMSFRESLATRLQRELDRERRRVSFRDEQLEAARQIARSNDHRARAYKGQITKMRKRMAAGACPVGSCKRSWTELHDHIRTCHPEFVHDLLGEAAATDDRSAS